MINVLRRIKAWLMENQNQLLEKLRVYLEQVNEQSLNRANVNVPTQQTTPNIGQQNDEMGSLIQKMQDEQELQDIINKDLSGNTPVTTKPTSIAPKTDGASLINVPTVVPVNSTVVVADAPKIQTKAPSTSVLKLNIDDETINKYTQQYKVPDPKISKYILQAAKDTGIDPNWLFKVARQESTFNPSARPIDRKTGKPLSSATGLFQIIDSTWSDILNKKGGKEKFGLKGDRLNPYENAVGGAIYLQHIKSQLAPVKEDLSITDLYLGHFAGPSVAKKALTLLESDKGHLPATAAFKPDQIARNKVVFYPTDNKGKVVGPIRSIEQVYNYFTKRVS